MGREQSLEIPPVMDGYKDSRARKCLPHKAELPGPEMLVSEVLRVNRRKRELTSLRPQVFFAIAFLISEMIASTTPPPTPPEAMLPIMAPMSSEPLGLAPIPL